MDNKTKLKELKFLLKKAHKDGKVSEWYRLSNEIKSLKIPKKDKMKKPSTTKLKSQLYKKVLLLAKLYVKKRDKNTCQKCKKAWLTWSNLQASHIIPVSGDRRLAVDHNNMKVLCYHCHLQRRHKNPLEASEWIKTKFPDRVTYLQDRYRNKPLWSINISEYEERLLFYENQK